MQLDTVAVSGLIDKGVTIRGISAVATLASASFYCPSASEAVHDSLLVLIYDASIRLLYLSVDRLIKFNPFFAVPEREPYQV